MPQRDQPDSSERSGRSYQVRIAGLPYFVDHRRLLGPADFSVESEDAGGRTLVGTLQRAEAADLSARLRGLGFGGQALQVSVLPPLPRGAVREARTLDAKRRRASTGGFLDRRARLDEEGRISLTPEVLATMMAKDTAGRTVVDACCGAGGNAIAFARAGARVTAVEIEANRLALARHNAAIYGVESRIRFVQGDAAEQLSSLSAELLFLDPPWGVDYSRTGVFLGDVPLLSKLLRHRHRFESVWIKLPPSFDPNELPDFEAQAVFGVAEGDYRRVKFLWLRSDRTGGQQL